MKSTFTFLLSLIACVSIAQNHPSCDGMRYREDVFADVEITEGLQYGTNTTFAGTQQDLFLDIYEPAGDQVEARPTIVFAFGGSFIAGERQAMAFLCEAFARKGYVAVTIDYRLYDGPFFPIPTAEDFTDVVIKSIGDMKAAVRFLREDAATDNEYRIDTERIFVGGISAGAITAAHVAVLDESDDLPDDILEIIENNGGIEGNTSDNYEYSSAVSGFVNYSGGLRDADWIDANDPPFISFHDDGDQVVPYAEGSASVFGIPIIEMDGSFVLTEVADAENVQNELNTIENSNEHVGFFYGISPEVDGTINTTAVFLYDLLCGAIDSDISEAPKVLSRVYPNPTTGDLLIETQNAQVERLVLRDLVGRKLRTWPAQNSINISDFEKGIYFLEIELAGGGSAVNKVILE